MAIDRSTVQGEFDNNEEVNKAKNAILGHEFLSGSNSSSDSSSLFSSHASSEDLIEVDVDNVGYEPPIQMMDRVVSNDPLFCIHHNTSSFGGDQTMMLASEECTPFSPAPTYVEPNREVKISEDKMKQCGGKIDTQKPAAKQTNPTHRSTESDSSSYSFAFPILVPLQQSGSSKTDGVSTHQSREEDHMDGENSISRPFPPPSSRRKCSWCCCFPFRSCCKPRR